MSERKGLRGPYREGLISMSPHMAELRRGKAWKTTHFGPGRMIAEREKRRKGKLLKGH